MAKKRFAPIPAKFFEEYPLLRKMAVELPVRAEWLAEADLYEPLTMRCGNCASPQSFAVSWKEIDGWWINLRQDARKEDGEAGPEPWHAPPDGDVAVVQFVCTRCSSFRHKFMFEVVEGGKAVRKVGQCPPHSIHPPEAVKQALGPFAEDYGKGSANESGGFGVGAFAYYRRVVENVIADLLEKVEGLIADSGEQEKYRLALENVRGSQSAKNRIEAVKGLLPDSLRPGGTNPLDVLYGALSVGLHQESDEFCLGMSAMVRESLTYLLTQIDGRLAAAAGYRDNLAEIKRRVEKCGKRKTDVQ